MTAGLYHCCPPGTTPGEALRRLVAAGLPLPPRPAGGATLQRWRMLAQVGEHDLSLAKLYEGHADALAIVQELAAPALAAQAGATWAVWAAEVPGARVQLHQGADGQLRISGTKAWCSGAQEVSHALLTAWRAHAQQPQLVAVELRQPGISMSCSEWMAVGMAASASATVQFDAVPVTPVGAPGAYVNRPGFWQGGAGVAACWWGGARRIARALHTAAATSDGRPGAPYQQAALGQVDVALAGSAALLREAARWIDAHPEGDARCQALRVRQAVEAAARHVLDEVTRALGATPLCRDSGFARHAADLAVFIRQSHGARDDAALGQALLAAGEAPWAL
ncbi:acyl-CoA dehydrogenase [Pulveribacter suum]|uniref:Acyl-CoA dehydrogenase n=1 Tax=Pulveribacter suum TaxID=2116657 RepID=A0A2P1NQ31_9BURK|nr:acyl-CoA dehydrogenase [Pulveribacter suum]